MSNLRKHIKKHQATDDAKAGCAAEAASTQPAASAVGDATEEKKKPKHRVGRPAKFFDGDFQVFGKYLTPKNMLSFYEFMSW